MRRIELRAFAWEANMLPLHYIRQEDWQESLFIVIYYCQIDMGFWTARRTHLTRLSLTVTNNMISQSLACSVDSQHAG